VAPGLVVVGLGGRGLEWAREVRSHGAFDLVACVDVDDAARQEAERQLGLPARAFHDAVEPALDQEGVEAVVVATPPEHHEAPCRLALDRGLAVLVEKPFTRDLDEATALVELGEARAAPLVVAQSYRHLRAHRATRAVVRNGRLGAVRQVNCRHYRIEPQPAIRGHDGTLWDLVAHHLDAIRDLLDAEPTAVLARSFDDGLSVEVLLEFGSDTRASYSATRRSSGHEFFEGGKEHYLRVTGERGTLHLLHRWLILCESGRLPRVLRRGRRVQTEDARLLDDLAGAMRGRPPEGLTGRSAAEHRWVAPRQGNGADG
jgi:predicted dehydrogenase